MPSQLFPRFAEARLEEALSDTPVVLIQPKVLEQLEPYAKQQVAAFCE